MTTIEGPTYYQETKWPRQWIALCPQCGGGIRCNTDAEAEEFVDEHTEKCFRSRMRAYDNEETS